MLITYALMEILSQVHHQQTGMAFELNCLSQDKVPHLKFITPVKAVSMSRILLDARSCLIFLSFYGH